MACCIGVTRAYPSDSSGGDIKNLENLSHCYACVFGYVALSSSGLLCFLGKISVKVVRVV